MRQQLPRPTPVDYQVERHNEAWADHRARTLVTGALVAWTEPKGVLDPACGDGSIIAAAHAARPFEYAVLNDISVPNVEGLKRWAPSHWTLMAGDAAEAIRVSNKVDAIILTEILEHIDEPDALLRRARVKGTWLIASSPQMRRNQVDHNPEHKWMFDHDGYREMLMDANWQPVEYTLMRFETEYDFGIWVCR